MIKPCTSHFLGDSTYTQTPDYISKAYKFFQRIKRGLYHNGQIIMVKYIVSQHKTDELKQHGRASF